MPNESVYQSFEELREFYNSFKGDNIPLDNIILKFNENNIKTLEKLEFEKDNLNNFPKLVASWSEYLPQYSIWDKDDFNFCKNYIEELKDYHLTNKFVEFKKLEKYFITKNNYSINPDYIKQCLKESESVIHSIVPVVRNEPCYDHSAFKVYVVRKNI